MNLSNAPVRKPSPKAGISRGVALVLAPIAWFVAIPLGHGVAPWAISLLAARHGWTMNRPGGWNFAGLIPVTVGAGGLLWVFVVGLRQAAELPDRIVLDWSPKLLLRRGPYSFTRNPMYIAELSLWLGWAIFFGSLAVLLGLALLYFLVTAIVRREERDLEARFGDAYREYQTAVPRWLGRTHD